MEMNIFFINICKLWFLGKDYNSNECAAVFHLFFKNFYPSTSFPVVLSEY